MIRPMMIVRLKSYVQCVFNQSESESLTMTVTLTMTHQASDPEFGSNTKNYDSDSGYEIV